MNSPCADTQPGLSPAEAEAAYGPNWEQVIRYGDLVANLSSGTARQITDTARQIVEAADFHPCASSGCTDHGLHCDTRWVEAEEARSRAVYSHRYPMYELIVWDTRDFVSNQTVGMLERLDPSLDARVVECVLCDAGEALACAPLAEPGVSGFSKDHYDLLVRPGVIGGCVEAPAT